MPSLPWPLAPRRLCRGHGSWRRDHIHGRSDATLNPVGVRVGTAEIYQWVERLDEVVESVLVGQEWDHGIRIVLCVVLRPGLKLNAALADKIKGQIHTACSPRPLPARVVQVEDIPRTKNGKIAELAVREVIHGRPVTNADALANPRALNMYRDIVALRD